MNIYQSRKADLILIACPIYISLLYIGAVYLFEEKKILIFFLFMMIFGETHFAGTWLYFTEAVNRKWVWSNKYRLILLPALLCTFYVWIGISNIDLAILIGSVASGIHVTRQSVGVFRLFAGRNNFSYELLIYALSFSWLAIGFYRFYLDEYIQDSIINDIIEYIKYLLCAVSVLSLILFYKSGRNITAIASLATGMSVYAAYGFVYDVKDAVVIGVGMHWCQYLALTGKIYFLSRSEDATGVNRKLLFTFLILYAIVFASIDTEFGSTYQSKNILVLIPLTLQLYHYYLDAFIWQFSDPHIRKHTGERLFGVI